MIKRKNIENKTAYKSFNFDLKVQNEEQGIIRGYASTVDVDRVGDRVFPESFNKSIERIKSSKRFPKLLYAHDGRDKLPLGVLTDLGTDTKGVWFEAKFSKATQLAREVKEQVKEGVLDQVSIGYMLLDSIPNEFGGVDFKETDLYELSITATPTQVEAVITSFKDKTTINPKQEETKMGLELKKPETFEQLSTQMLEMAKDMGEIKKSIGDNSGKMLPEEKIKLEKMEADFKELSAKFYAEQSKKIDRKLPVDKVEAGTVLPYKQLLWVDSKTPATEYHRKVKRFQELNDAIYVADSILQRKSEGNRNYRYGGVEKLAFWPEYNALVSDITGKALDTTTSGEGSQWIPTEFSPQFMDTLYQHFPLWNYFQTFPQPTATFNWPIFSSDTEAKLIAETTAIQTTIGDSNEETPTTAVAAFVAKKARGTIVWSGEIQEDVSFDIVTEIQRKIAKEIYIATEAAMISGDDTTTYFDTGLSLPLPSTNFRRAYKGLRYLGLNNSAFIDNAGATLSWTLITTALNKMGSSGLVPTENGVIFPMGLYYKSLALTEVKTMDVFGPFATIVNGVLQKIGGMDVVACGQYRQDLNAAGIFDNVTTTQSSFIIVNKPAWRMGIIRDLGLEVERIAGWDQFKIYGWHRHSFGPIAGYVTTAQPLVYSYDVV